MVEFGVDINAFPHQISGKNIDGYWRVLAIQMMAAVQNPIVPGFAPDPSVVFVDGTFFLVNSSFHVFPGLPIYASRNLRDWKQIGNAINRPEQLSLVYACAGAVPLPTGYIMVALGGLFAATIRHHDGVFYVICTNASFKDRKIELQNFYVKSRDIWSSEWSDPVPFDFGGIDPSLFFDDDGRAYIQGSWSISRAIQPSCTIKQFEVDIKTGKKLSEVKEIWGGFVKHDTEGPHIYKKDGYYYLLVAEGGTFEHHMLSIARSKNIWGPYESFEKNPILTADGKHTYIQNTGHGEIFQDGDGLWWAVVLAVRDPDGRPDGRRPLGRETFLTPVEWPENGWPKFEQPAITMERPGARVLSLVDDLPSQRYAVGNLWIRQPILKNYTVTEDGSRIGICAGTSDLSFQTGSVSFLGQRQRSLDSTVCATLNLSSSFKLKTLRAGLAVYKDDLRHAEIYYDYGKSTVCFAALNKVTAMSNYIQSAFPCSGNVTFEVRANGYSYNFSFCGEGEGVWRPLGAIDTIDMSGHDMTGPVFGVFAVAAAEEDGIAIEFTDFEIKGV